MTSSSFFSFAIVGRDDVGIAVLHLQQEIEPAVLPGLAGFRAHGEEHALRRLGARDLGRAFLGRRELFHMRLIDREIGGGERIADADRAAPSLPPQRG